MQLTVLDRIALLGILPEQGNFLTLRIVRELRESLESFTAEEQLALDFQRDEEGRVQWKAEAEPNKDFDFDRASLRVIEDALKDADTRKKLTLDHIHLYELFMETDEEQPTEMRKYGG